MALVGAATAQRNSSGMDSIAWKAGDGAPGLSLPDAKGEPVRLNQLLQQGPVVAISRQTPDHPLNAW